MVGVVKKNDCTFHPNREFSRVVPPENTERRSTDGGDIRKIGRNAERNLVGVAKQLGGKNMPSCRKVMDLGAGKTNSPFQC